MLNINNLERQHKEIWEVFLKIQEVVESNYVIENLDSLVMNINVLAGKLNIHMQSEDKYLYPELMKNGDEELRTIAKQYSQEMGSIHMEFNTFKNKFNTRNKILNNINEFLIESKKVLTLLHNRISKEDKHLYPKVKVL